MRADQEASRTTLAGRVLGPDIRVDLYVYVFMLAVTTLAQLGIAGYFVLLRAAM